MTEKLLITPMEAKEILGVGKNTIYRLCNAEGFPVFRIGRTLKINRTRLLEWTDKNLKEGA